MKIQKLIVFGCSWAFGDELIDPRFATEEEYKDHYKENEPYRLSHCYGNLVAKHFDLEFINMAWPGSSLESMCWNLHWYINNGNSRDDVMMLFGLTDATRMSWYNPQHQGARDDPPWNRHMHGAWITPGSPAVDANWYDLKKLWMGMSYHRDWAEFNYWRAVNLFDQAQSRWSIPVIQFNNLDNPWASGNVPSLIYPGQSFKQILAAKKKELNIEPFARGGHPNEQGHQIIADHLIEHIKYSKMLG